MPAKLGKTRPSLESLERRLACSALPLNTIGVAAGDVPAPGAVDQVSIGIPAHVFALNKPSTVISLTATPAPASPLEPSIVSTHGPTGARLPLHQGAPFNARRHPSAMAYTLDNLPGPLATGVTGQRGTKGPFNLQAALPGDVNGDGHVDFGDLESFVKAFTATSNDAFYKPSADANKNGFVGHGDARFLERNFTPSFSRAVPLDITFHLAPGEQVLHPPVHNSGGITHDANAIIMGHTLPGSIVFSDSSLGNYTFDGLAIATDAHGNFQQKVHLTDPLTNFEFLAIDPYGRQVIRAFPVYFLAAR